jgi:hypothetical protein
MKEKIKDKNAVFRSRIASLKGFCGEKMIQYQLEDQDFTVINIFRDYKNKTESHKRYFDKDKLMIELKKYEGDKEKVINLIHKYSTGIPDLLCIKKNQIKFIEVKTIKNNNKFDSLKKYSKLSSIQIEASKEIKKEGFDYEIHYLSTELVIENRFITNGIDKIEKKEISNLNKFF